MDELQGHIAELSSAYSQWCRLFYINRGSALKHNI